MPNSCQKSVPGLTLSVSVGEVQITSISESTLQNIWEKAERLLSTPNAIAPAPGNSNAPEWLPVSHRLVHISFKRVQVEGLFVMTTA